MNKQIFSIPNIVSFIRIIIVVFAAIELANGNNINAFLLYLTAAITDFLDGLLARYLNQITSLGKVLDPIADKLMIGSAIIILATQGRMPLWFVIMILAGSVFNLAGGLLLIKKYNYVPSAIMLGKIAAVIIMVTFLLNIVNFLYIEYLYYFATIFFVASIVGYVVKSVREIGRVDK